jgi:WD40 repeat protein
MLFTPFSDFDSSAGPPELLFIHSGHTDKVGDLSWNSNKAEEWTIASVADDNVLQIWRPNQDVLYESADEEEDEGGDENLQSQPPTKKSKTAK